jgi:hypothetical protein
VLDAVGVAVTMFGERIAVWMAPPKEAATSRCAAALKADDLFWNTFHNGEYDRFHTPISKRPMTPSLPPIRVVGVSSLPVFTSCFE